jgi:hypothetical protein
MTQRAFFNETDMTIYKGQFAVGTNSQMRANFDIANSYIQSPDVDNAQTDFDTCGMRFDCVSSK